MEQLDSSPALPVYRGSELSAAIERKHKRGSCPDDEDDEDDEDEIERDTWPAHGPRERAGVAFKVICAT